MTRSRKSKNKKKGAKVLTLPSHEVKKSAHGLTASRAQPRERSSGAKLKKSRKSHPSPSSAEKKSEVKDKNVLASASSLAKPASQKRNLSRTPPAFKKRPAAAGDKPAKNTAAGDTNSTSKLNTKIHASSKHKTSKSSHLAKTHGQVSNKNPARRTSPTLFTNDKHDRHDNHGSRLTEAEKATLLDSINKIVRLHYVDKHGLKSLTTIARIIDSTNQRYTTPSAKFDAILKFAMMENPATLNEHIYVFIQNRDPETAAFYQCLSGIARQKLSFHQARTQLEKMFHVAFEKRHGLHAN